MGTVRFLRIKGKEHRDSLFKKCQLWATVIVHVDIKSDQYILICNTTSPIIFPGLEGQRWSFLIRIPFFFFFFFFPSYFHIPRFIYPTDQALPRLRTIEGGKLKLAVLA